MNGGMRTLSTFIAPLLAAFVGLIAFPVGIVLLYIAVDYAPDRAVRPYPLLAVSGVGFLIGVWLFRSFAGRLSRRFVGMIDGMNRLLEDNGAATGATMPVDARDEFGELSVAFNELQAYASRRHRAAQQELALSDRLQRRLLPEGTLRTDAFECAAECRQTKEVGGDLFDFVPLDGGRLAVVVGDVAGKGMPAALMMTAMLALFRREIRSGGPAEVLARLNRLACRALQGRSFVTMGLSILDAERETVVYASAGHMPPYVLREGEANEIETSSLPLGIAEQAVFREQTFILRTGERLVLFTDGMVECGSPEGDRFGFARFRERLAGLDPLAAPAGQAAALMQSTEAGGPEPSDDRTIVIVRRTL